MIICPPKGIRFPIMVSVLQRLNDGGNDEQKQLLQLMIERSENDPADRLMEVVIFMTGKKEQNSVYGMTNTGLINTHLYVGITSNF